MCIRDSDGSDITDFSSTKQFPYFCPVRGITVVERDPACLPRPLFSIQNRLDFLFIGRHRLFCDNIGSQLHSPDNELVVCAVHCRDNQYIRLCLVHHFLKVGKMCIRDRPYGAIPYIMGENIAGLCPPYL